MSDWTTTEWIMALCMFVGFVLIHVVTGIAADKTIERIMRDE